MTKRSSRTPPSTPTVVIVGAGAAGLSAAYALTDLGASDVTVLERRHVAAGSSGVSAGIYCRQYSERTDIELRVKSYAELCRLEDRTDLAIRRNGYLRLARGDATLEEFRRGVEFQRELGVTDAELLDRAGLGRIVPDMRTTDFAGGMFSPSDGYTDGQQVCVAYAECAERLGAQLKANHEVIELAPAVNHRFAVVTTTARFEADVVVNAAGAWADRIGQIFGAPVPMLPERHQVCVFELESPLSYTLPTVMDYVPGSGTEGLYFRPEGDRQLLAGLHTNEVLDEDGADPDAFGQGVDDEYADDVVRKLAHRLPTLADRIGLRGGWAGLYPNSADNELIIGPMPGQDGIFSLCGLDGNGIYLSPIAGRLLAEWILYGETPSFRGSSRFLPSRFGAVPSGSPNRRIAT